MDNKGYLQFRPRPGLTAATEIVERLRKHGHASYLIGGCVRDELLGRTAKDYDVVTSALPESVEAIFSGTTKAIGAKFGVIQVRWAPECPFRYPKDVVDTEVATFRSDGAYSDNRRPDDVKFSTSLEEDVQRRDFTMNGIAASPYGPITDLVGGLQDIADRLIRCIGVPEERFKEDALRMLRAIRFAAQLDFRIESSTWQALRDQAGLVASISHERVRDELVKMLISPDPARALYLLNQSGLLDVLFPSGITNQFHRILLKLQWAQQHAADYLTMLTLLTNHIMTAEVDRFLVLLKLSVDEEKQIRNARLMHYYLTATGTSFTRAERIRYLRQPGFMVAVAYTSACVAIDGCLTVEDWEHIKASFLDLNTSEIVHERLLITGDDLIARGINPSPAFKLILNQFETEQLNLLFTTREEALLRLDRVQVKGTDETF